MPAVFNSGYLEAIDYSFYYPEVTAQVDRVRVLVDYSYTPSHHPIPEPTTGLLLSVGTAGLVVWRRRMNRAQRIGSRLALRG